MWGCCILDVLENVFVDSGFGWCLVGCQSWMKLWKIKPGAIIAGVVDGKKTDKGGKSGRRGSVEPTDTSGPSTHFGTTRHSRRSASPTDSCCSSSSSSSMSGSSRCPSKGSRCESKGSRRSSWRSRSESDGEQSDSGMRRSRRMSCDSNDVEDTKMEGSSQSPSHISKRLECSSTTDALAKETHESLFRG